MRRLSCMLLGIALVAFPAAVDAVRVDDDDDADYDDEFADVNPNDMSLFQAEEGVGGEHPKSKYFNTEILLELRCVQCLMKASGREYFVAEGTLLGTVRDGFIVPWDADGDIVFDTRNVDGKVDYDGFYKIFSPGPVGTGDLQKCPKCGNMAVHLFVPGHNISGVEMHYFQSYEDILAGRLVELHSSTKRDMPPDMKEELLKASKEPNSARIHWNTDPAIRVGGHGYLDVAPFNVYNDSKVDVLENVTKHLSYADVFPTKLCTTRSFGENKTRKVKLSCPNNPRPYLDQTYENGWATAPYNKYSEEEGWTKDGDATLEETCRKMYNYSGPLEPMLKE